jgi:hypothetical protein
VWFDRQLKGLITMVSSLGKFLVVFGIALIIISYVLGLVILSTMIYNLGHIIFCFVTFTIGFAIYCGTVYVLIDNYLK